MGIFMFSRLTGLAGARSGGCDRRIVVDQSAAPIAAHVVARNLATDLVRETTANANGLFRIPLLPVGDYSLTVEAPHFATVVQTPLTIDVSQTARVAYQLQSRL